MNNSKALFDEFVKKITLQENSDEIKSMVYLLFDHVFGLSQTDVIAGKPVDSTIDIDYWVTRINAQEPVQYITGKADFFGRRFKVNPAVLIPRPETEELVDFIIRHFSNRKNEKLRMLDIGTGSGCIPISLAFAFNQAKVYATDISKNALQLAKQNAVALDANVTYMLHDVLTQEISLSNLDLVVSNPPYITPGEKAQMKNNVLNYEPHLALFTPGEDALVFYRAIVAKASKALKAGGLLAVEINERFGSAVANIFRDHDYEDVQVIQDVAGKDRIVKGTLDD